MNLKSFSSLKFLDLILLGKIFPQLSHPAFIKHYYQLKDHVCLEEHNRYSLNLEELQGYLYKCFVWKVYYIFFKCAVFQKSLKHSQFHIIKLEFLDYIFELSLQIHLTRSYSLILIMDQTI